MNMKVMSIAAAVAVSTAFAQDYNEYEEPSSAVESTTEEAAPEAAAEEAEPAPAPVAMAPKVEEPAPIVETEAAPAAAPAPEGFNVLHGNAYNMVGNEAGASTIGGDMNAVYKMNGRNLVYIEPSGSNAALAVTSGSTTYLLGFDAGNPNLVTAGFAMKSFGLAVDFAFDKNWSSKEETEDKDKTETDVSTTNTGDNIRLKFGALLGGLDLTGNVYWYTFDREVDTEVTSNGNKSEEDNDKWDIGANLNISNGPSGKNLFWSVGLDFLRHKNFQKTKRGNTSTETTYSDSHIEIEPYFNFAVPLFNAANAQVFIGTNSRIPVMIYDEIENGNRTNNVFDVGLYTRPNILGQYAFNENWMLFAEACYFWEVYGLRSESIEGKAYSDDTTIMRMSTYGTYANGGARFSYNNLAIEASIASDLGTNSWSGLIGNLGVFLIF